MKELKLEKHSDKRGDLYVFEESDIISLDNSYFKIIYLSEKDKLELRLMNSSILILDGSLVFKYRDMSNFYNNQALIKSLNGKLLVESLSESIILLISTNEIIFSDFLNIKFQNIKVPFKSKRIFFVKNVPQNSRRGQHAHKFESQFLCVVKGGVNVDLSGYKNDKISKTLTKRGTILLPPLYWTDISKFKADSVLLVFCSSFFDPDEYIVDKRFLKPN